MPLGTAELAHPQLRVRERAFLRALIHNDYINHLSHISGQQIEFTTDNPACKVFITLFNYCDGALLIEIHPAKASSLSVSLKNMGQEWTDLLCRAERSDHRLHLNVAKVPYSLGTKHWVVPLRTSTSTLHQAIRLLATNPEDEDIMDAVGSRRQGFNSPLAQSLRTNGILEYTRDSVRENSPKCNSGMSSGPLQSAAAVYITGKIPGLRRSLTHSASVSAKASLHTTVPRTFRKRLEYLPPLRSRVSKCGLGMGMARSIRLDLTFDFAYATTIAALMVYFALTRVSYSLILEQLNLSNIAEMPETVQHGLNSPYSRRGKGNDASGRNLS
ncbi:hypothetical protein B0H14DRAFT_2556970 [Mycena olivaceomarginata]|nr:hypothetical protein B0H14DRAFT_2556970 [Mycena olivaceomarginata]